MTENIDPLANIFNERSPKDINDFRNILEEAIEATGANENLPDIGNFLTEVEISKKEDHTLTTDIHVPKGEGPFPILVYFHGGGWISGSPKSHRKICHRFAEAGILVFNVDYALAPENPFPQGFDECCEALRWVVDNAPEYNGNSNNLSVGGDSAGGNLTAACAAALIEDNQVNIKKNKLTSREYSITTASGENKDEIEANVFKENIGQVRTKEKELIGNDGVALAKKLLKEFAQPELVNEKKAEYQTRIQQGILELLGLEQDDS